MSSSNFTTQILTRPPIITLQSSPATPMLTPMSINSLPLQSILMIPQPQILQIQPQPQTQPKSTTPSKICRYLVQLDRENNSAFFTIRQEQSPTDKNRMEDIFTLLKNQQVIRQDCRCFGALLSQSNENNNMDCQDIYKGGTQLICQDEKDPNETVVIVVKNLELMKTELQNLAKSQNSSTSTTTVLSLNNAKHNDDNNQQEQSTTSTAVISEKEKVLKQRQLLQLMKKRRQTEVDDNNTTNNNSSASPVSSSSATQVQPQKVYLLRTTTKNNNNNKDTIINQQNQQAQVPITVSGSTTKFIRLGSSGNFIALPSSSSNQIENNTISTSKTLVPSRKSLSAQVQTGGINISSTTPVATNSQHVNEPLTSYFITHPGTISTITNNFSTQNNSQISNVYIFSPQARDNNSNILKCWESRFKEEKNVLMPHENWFCNFTTRTTTPNVTEKALNIYELETNTTSGCLEISRSVQMTETGKLTVGINFQECTDCFMKPDEREDRFCTFENVIEIIKNVNNHQLCRGCDGFEHVSMCQDGIRHGSKWFSIHCPKVIQKVISTVEQQQQCTKCKELEATLKL